MNAISLYVSTSRIILHNDPNAQDHKIADLYRLVPYLRQSMSCAVCGRLLKDPFSPKDAKCQHNVCRLCVRGRKNVRPTCNYCKDCQDFRTYEENKQMRILLQCYKGMCEHIMSTTLYSFICKQSIQTSSVVSGIIIPNLSLVELIEEGANFEDILMAFTTDLPKTYAKLNQNIANSVPASNPTTQVFTGTTSQLPLIIKQEFPMIDMSLAIPVTVTQTASSVASRLNNTSVSINTAGTSVPTVATSSIKLRQINKPPNFVQQHRNVLTAAPLETKTIMVTPGATAATQIRNPPPIKTVSNGTAMYSVLYTGIGNKITIKRKTDVDEENSPRKAATPTLFRQVTKQNSKRRGCRCGNATATPGKLTCCGQRCPCYVDSKSCIGCKCRGCRNPHRPDGGKVIPVIPELACYEIYMADDNTNLTGDLPITKDHQNTNKHLMSTPSFRNQKDYVPNELPAASRLTVMSNTGPLPHRSQTLHQQQQQNLKQTYTPTNTNKVQRDQGVMQLESLSQESLLIQSPEGKYQVVNVFTSASHQKQPNVQRIHSISHNNTGSTFIVPNTNSQLSSSIHQIPEISTTLPQIIMQQPTPQQLSSNNKSSMGSSNQVSAYTKQNNLITVHTVPSHSVSQSKTASMSLSTTPTTFTLSPIIVTSPSSFTSELFQDDDYLTSSHASTGDSPLSISHPSLHEVVETEF